MKKLFLTITLLLVLAHPCVAEESELTGVVSKTVKALSPYRIKLDGTTGSFYLRGEVLKSVPDGTRMWVRGTIQSSLYDNRNDPTPAMPMQWHIYMNVNECKRIKKPFERPKEKTLQNKTPLSDPVLLKLQDKIEQALTKLDQKPTFEIPKSSAGKSLVVRYKTRQYTIHPRNKAGRISQDTVQREGPSDDGFLLRAHVQPLGEVNQASVPQTIRQTYWSLDLQVYEIEKEKKQIYFALSYNSRTDQKLIKKMKEIAEQIGAPYSPKAAPSVKR